jgi:hypothetical protein
MPVPSEMRIVVPLVLLESVRRVLPEIRAVRPPSR